MELRVAVLFLIKSQKAFLSLKKRKLTNPVKINSVILTRILEKFLHHRLKVYSILKVMHGHINI